MSNSMWPHRRQSTSLPHPWFSRQEHGSGLPFPSPMHESEKWKWSRSVVSDSLWPYGLQPTRLLHPWDFPGKSTGVGCHCFLHLIKLILWLKLFHRQKAGEDMAGAGGGVGEQGPKGPAPFHSLRSFPIEKQKVRTSAWETRAATNTH